MKKNISKLKNKFVKSETLQYKKTYQSTLAFESFLKKKINDTSMIIDIGCGQGGTLSYYCRKYNKLKFIGLDYRNYNVKISRYLSKKYKIKNVEFFQVDLLKRNFKKKLKNLKIKNPIGIISEKTFCTFKKLDLVLDNLISLKPEFIAINSLFYEGDMDVYTHITGKQNENNVDGDFNIHSLQKLKKYLKKFKYRITKVNDFFPEKKIISNRLKRGTYTLETEMSKRTMFSGPVYLPWKFVMIEKLKN